MAPNCEVKNWRFFAPAWEIKNFPWNIQTLWDQKCNQNFYKFCQNALKVMDPEFGN